MILFALVFFLVLKVNHSWFVTLSNTIFVNHCIIFIKFSILCIPGVYTVFPCFLFLYKRANAKIASRIFMMKTTPLNFWFMNFVSWSENEAKPINSGSTHLVGTYQVWFIILKPDQRSFQVYTQVPAFKDWQSPH